LVSFSSFILSLWAKHQPSNLKGFFPETLVGWNKWFGTSCQKKKWFVTTCLNRKTEHDTLKKKKKKK
jgi:hypothetical protein